jgi:hypothetical protein
MLIIVLSVDLVASATSQVPERDTSEVSLVLESTDEILHGFRLEITSAWSSSIASRQTNIELGVLTACTLFDNVLPVIVIESIP